MSVKTRVDPGTPPPEDKKSKKTENDFVLSLRCPREYQRRIRALQAARKDRLLESAKESAIWKKAIATGILALEDLEEEEKARHKR